MKTIDISISASTLAIIIGIAAALGGFATAIVNVTSDPRLLLIGSICGVIGTAITTGVTAYSKAVAASTAATKTLMEGEKHE